MQHRALDMEQVEKVRCIALSIRSQRMAWKASVNEVTHKFRTPHPSLNSPLHTWTWKGCKISLNRAAAGIVFLTSGISSSSNVS